MGKKTQRWYEKDQYLCAFMNLMQDINIEVQCELAVDIIIKSSSMIDRDYTKMVEEVALYNPKDFKRWYDKNPIVHLAIESMRDLSDEQRDMIVKEFSEKILNSHYIKLDDVGEMP